MNWKPGDPICGSVPEKTLAQKQVKEDPEIRVGDMVRIEGQDTAGEVLEIRGKKCVVAFGMLKTNTKLEQLEKIRAEEAGRLRIKDQIKGGSGRLECEYPQGSVSSGY